LCFGVQKGLLRTSLTRSERSAISVAEKKRIVAAIRARDGAAAQREIEEHITLAAKAALETFRAPSNESENPPKPSLNPNRARSVTRQNGRGFLFPHYGKAKTTLAVAAAIWMGLQYSGNARVKERIGSGLMAFSDAGDVRVLR
jgi:hypothetical protein